ncbi:hypothetical protein Turpa_0034 [Turneriella parva DSM 21527]|uniref:ISXO2-like transposase domain-containing protein n=1 Tax=Turneriella parva (strain ATCC BAA-1111 / DSM 21527 / NCTC 11395 / H) TaxID=869212 RepID=I4B090_TURPD|nr:hypothetical protein Turpa_0034 [Turneriella parva DSM 21527]
MSICERQRCGQIFNPTATHSRAKPRNRSRGTRVDTTYYTQLTDLILSEFYPRICCGEKVTKQSPTRELVLRCPTCHKEHSKLAGPFRKLRVPRWTISYLLKEAQVQYPKVLTVAEIKRRLGLSSTGTAYLLKRRIQLFASDLVPRMQEAFYRDNKLRFGDFRFPRDREADLTELVKDKPIPQADTLVLYSVGNLSNKGRKRFRRKGQTSSIYRSSSVDGRGEQVGTLVNTVAVKNGPAFFDSIPNQKAETVNPILFKYIPVHNPVFTDGGYSLPSMNHRTINHSLKSKDKRHTWSRGRWSKNGIHTQVAEGRQGILKRAFRSYGWLNPKYSTLALNEFTAIGNLRYFGLEDLLPDESKENPVRYQLDDNWSLRDSRNRNMPGHRGPVSELVSKQTYDAKTLLEIQHDERKSDAQRIKDTLTKVPDLKIRRRLQLENHRYRRWLKGKTTQDQRRKQRYYQTLAESIWHTIPSDSLIEIHDLARRHRISGKHIYRLLGIWTAAGLIETIDLNRKTKNKIIEYYDIRRLSPALLPILYIMPKAAVPEFNKRWHAKARRIA